MKLLTKTSLLYLCSSIPILILSGFICYYIVTKEVKESSDEFLMNIKTQIDSYLEQNDTLSLKAVMQSKEALITKVKPFNSTGSTFSDTLIFDRKENEFAVNRMITSFKKVRNENFRIKIWRSTLEFDELMEGILASLLTVLVLLIGLILIINVYVSKILWKPFHNTVHSLRTFRASDRKVPELKNTSVLEFADLNSSAKTMMDKMIVDYQSQKKFAENASHEIQTPLSIIKTKIDLLIQSENLDENDMDLILAIDDSCSKLIRLNKSLLLLTKIENRQFKTTGKVAISKMISNSIEIFDEHIKARRIHIFQNIEKDFMIAMNPDLCQILINNLMQNAIRHNSEGGSIIIFIRANSLTIHNSGKKEPLDEGFLFSRFQKDSLSDQSIGLGLAITKEIINTSGLNLTYKYISEKHCFILTENNI